MNKAIEIKTNANTDLGIIEISAQEEVQLNRTSYAHLIDEMEAAEDEAILNRLRRTHQARARRELQHRISAARNH